ncbi:MAG: GNAT family N-acetyltransferase [Anaerolineae bacterium]|jgi:GNAT superfamily N-acetyltransferase
MVRIEYLADYPEHIPVLAQWHYAQWAYLDVGVSAAQRAAVLRKHGRDTVPMTLVALSGDTLLGSASLIQHDMDTRMDLSPWLASVYVDPPYRERGIGSALVEAIVDRAERLGFSALYLFTPDRAPFYERLGWHILEHTIYRGYAQTVMALSLEKPGEERG